MAVVQYTFTHNKTQNDTKQTIHRTTQQFWKSAGRAHNTLFVKPAGKRAI